MSFDKQKVFMIGWEYPPHNSGGLGVACDGLTQALSGQNTQIYFTLPYNFGGGARHMQMMSCFDEDWQDLDRPPFSPYVPLIQPFGDEKPFNAAKLRSLPGSQMEQKVMEYADMVAKQANSVKDDFSVIHAHDWMSFPAAMEAKKKTGKPMIAQIHSTEYDRSVGEGNQYISQIEKEGLEFADHIVAVSSFTRQLLINKYHINKNKVSVVHNGILPLKYSDDQNSKTFAKKHPVVVFMGRLTIQKGAEYFIRLASEILKDMPEVLFIVAGNGDMYHELLFKNAGVNLSASVLFSGFVRGAQKAKLLKRADVFVMPSISEPFGLVALEAAQMNTPVIVSKTSGVREVLPSAIQVDFWDTNKMTIEVTRLLKDKVYNSHVSQSQNQELEKVTWENAALKMRNIYRRAFLG